MKATVKYPANQPKQTRFGMRINVVLTSAEGEEIKLWGDENDASLKVLRKGQAVEVFKDKKGNWQLSNEKPAAQPAAGGGPLPELFQKPSKQVRENMMEFIKWEASVYKVCYLEAVTAMKDFDLDKYNLKDIATTLFLSAVRKYRLQ